MPVYLPASSTTATQPWRPSAIAWMTSLRPAVSPTMGGEDFARYAKKLGVPGLQYRVGTIAREKWEAAQQPGAAPLPSLHSALYYPEPEPTMQLTVESMANLALGLMAR